MCKKLLHHGSARFCFSGNMTIKKAPDLPSEVEERQVICRLLQAMDIDILDYSITKELGVFLQYASRLFRISYVGDVFPMNGVEISPFDPAIKETGFLKGLLSDPHLSVRLSLPDGRYGWIIGGGSFSHEYNSRSRKPEFTYEINF